MKYDAIIFDLDGTLWDSRETCVKGWNTTLEKLGAKERIDHQGMTSAMGKPQPECVELLLGDLSKKIPDLAKKMSEGESRVVRAEGGRLYPKVRQGMKELARLYRVFIVSNCEDWYLDCFLNQAAARPGLEGWDCYGLSKIPKAEMLRKMKQDYGLKKPVYVGDTAGDEQAAAEAGMDFIWAGYGFGEPEQKEKYLSFDSFPKLVEYFKKAAGN